MHCGADPPPPSLPAGFGVSFIVLEFAFQLSAAHIFILAFPFSDIR